MKCHKKLMATMLFIMVLVALGAHATDGKTSTPEEVTMSSEVGLAAVADKVCPEPVSDDGESLQQVEGLNGEPSQVPASCTYTCPNQFPGLCPYIQGSPPAQCINGCCVYDTGGCENTCSFDSDCGPQASCWSGCCYYWRPQASVDS